MVGQHFPLFVCRSASECRSLLFDYFVVVVVVVVNVADVVVWHIERVAFVVLSIVVQLSALLQQLHLFLLVFLLK